MTATQEVRSAPTFFAPGERGFGTYGMRLSGENHLKGEVGFASTPREGISVHPAGNPRHSYLISACSSRPKSSFFRLKPSGNSSFCESR